MVDTKVACCSFPSRIVMIDDNRRFLQSLAFNVDDLFSCSLFVKPFQALQFLREEYQSQLDTQQWLDFSTALPKHSLMLKISPRKILQQIHNASRFDEISVVVVDYAMPNINGLEVCQLLADLPIKKVLLTGKADHAIAVQAFNEGLIDHFIRKDDLHFRENFCEAIKRLQHAYFVDNSATLLNNIASRKPTCLLTENYQRALQNFFEQHQLREYYLIDTLGSILGLNENGLPYWFIVRSEQDMQNMSEYAEKQTASANIISELTERDSLPFFGLAKSFNETDVTEWEMNLYPCQRFSTEHGDFYYSSIEMMLQEELAPSPAELTAAKLTSCVS